MAWTEVFPLDIVRQNALQIYQVEANTWGDRNSPPSTNSSFSPRLATPIYGVAIDPDSDFDSVVIVPSVGIGTPSPSNADRLPVTKDSLLAGRFSFPRIKSYDGGFFFACPAADGYGNLYRDTDGVIKPFGRSLNTSPALTFFPPIFRSITYIDALTSPPSLSRRPPKSFTRIAAHPDASVPFFVVPIYGRKLARVTLFATAPRAIKINGVTSQPNVPFPDVHPNTAFPLATLALAAGVVGSISLTDLACNFLVIKADVDAAPGSLEALIQVLD